MSLNTDFREVEDIKRLQKVIEKRVEEIGRPLRIMEFCGGPHAHHSKIRNRPAFGRLCHLCSRPRLSCMRPSNKQGRLGH